MDDLGMDGELEKCKTHTHGHVPPPGADTGAYASAGGTGAGCAMQSGACPACPAICPGQSGARPVDLAAAEGHNPFIVQGRLSACEFYKLCWRGDWLDAFVGEGDDPDNYNLNVTATFCAGCAGSGADAAGATAGAPVGSAASGQAPERQTSGWLECGSMLLMRTAAR